MSRPEDETPPDAGFLSRWSRRKQEARQTPATPDLEGPSPTLPSPPPPALPAQPETEASTQELPPLPSLDDIQPGTDVTAFFQAHVPEALRTAALRKLWITDPDIRNFIEMADYQWDFNNPDSIPGWSSTLPGLDVKAMAAKILNPTQLHTDAAAGETSEETARTEADAALALTEDAGLEHVREFTNVPVISSSSASEPPSLDTSAGNDVAVQNNQNESDIYTPLRRRHGGALPT